MAFPQFGGPNLWLLLGFFIWCSIASISIFTSPDFFSWSAASVYRLLFALFGHENLLNEFLTVLSLNLAPNEVSNRCPAPVPHPTPCIFFAIPTDSLPLLFCIDYTYAVWSQANCFGRWQLPAPNIWLIPYLKSPIWTNNAFYILYEQEKTFAANIFW